MSTNAIFSFVSDVTGETFHVYKHWDGYPEGGLKAIARACRKAWQLNRFEPDEFGAAFIAANKDGEGDLRLLPSGRWQDVSPVSCEYRYTVIQFKSGHVHVYVDAIAPVGLKYGIETWKEDRIFEYSLKDIRDKFTFPGDVITVIPSVVS